eukprot:6178341-Pleurochrysis_carterae.AAC.1
MGTRGICIGHRIAVGAVSTHATQDATRAFVAEAAMRIQASLSCTVSADPMWTYEKHGTEAFWRAGEESRRATQSRRVMMLLTTMHGMALEWR